MSGTGRGASGCPVAPAGVILSGGRSRRMGQDKALLQLEGETLLARTVRRLAPQAGELAISVNGVCAPDYLATGLPLLADLLPGWRGPLAGIHAGLEWRRRRGDGGGRLLSVAVDTPFFPADLGARLQGALPAEPGDDLVVIAASGGRLHPAFGLWPVALAGALAGFLEQGGRRLHGFLETCRVIAVHFDETDGGDPFFNINRPQDMRVALCQERRGGGNGSSGGLPLS